MGTCKGCSAKNTNDQSTKLSFKFELSKFKKQIDLLKERILTNCAVQQKQLIEQFKKPVNVRSRKSEEASIIQIIYSVYKSEICQILKNKAEIAITYIDKINNISSNDQTLYPAFRYILYCQSIFNDENLDKICKRIRSQDSNIEEDSDANIDDKITVSVKRRQKPTQKMCSQYVLRLCSANQITLEQINAVGHQYRYGL